MENKVHYKLFKNGKFLCTMALSTVAVLTTFGATNVHADATPVQNNTEQSEQTSQSTYQQKASQNEQQLLDLASANATKEANAANSYAQANQQENITKKVTPYAQTVITNDKNSSDLTDIQRNNALNINNSGTASTAIINPSSDNSDSVEQPAQNVAVGYLPNSDAEIGKNYYLPYGEDWKDDQNSDANRLNYLQLGAYNVTQDTLPNVPKSAMPTDVDQIPLTFKPGLLVYNPDTDKSAKIGPNGLSDDQIKLLTSMLLSWSNDFRQEVYRLYPELYTKLTKTDLRQGDSNLPLPVINTDRSQALGDAIAKLREENNLDNDTHTAVALNDQVNALFNQYGFTTDKLANTVKNIFKGDNTYKNNFSDIVSNVSFTGEALPSEDLETMDAQNGTLLNYAVNLYNMTQAMYWSETLRLGGHAVSALYNSNHALAISFQKLNKVNDANGATKEKYPAYAVTSNWIGIGYYVLNNNLEGKLHNFELNLPNYYSQIYGTEIDNPEFDQIKNEQLPQLVKKTASNKTAALTHGQLLNLSDYQMPLTSTEKNNNAINKAYQFTFNSDSNLNTDNVLTMRYTNLNNATLKLENGQSVPIDAIEYHFSNIVPINSNQKVAIRLYDTPNGFSTTNIKSIDMTPSYFTKDQNGDYQQIDPTNGVVYVTNLSTKYVSLAKTPKLTGKIIFPANTPLLDAKSVIENYTDYPNAKFKWADNNIPVLGQTSKDLIVDFLNGDSETIKVPITVLPMNKFYQPQLQLKKQQSYQYNELPTPDSFITNANILPSGAEITFDKLGTPNATSKSKNQLAVIKIAYPDGTVGYNTVTLNLNLMASQYVIVGKSIVSNYGVLPNASSALDASRSYLPESDKYTVSWVEPIDTSKTGFSMYHIKVTFTDGSSLVTSAGVTINKPSSANYNLSLDPMKRATAGEEEPASYFVTAGLPGGTKYEWVKAPDFNTQGTQNVTIKATFPDGSTKTVSGSIEVGFNFGVMAASDPITTKADNSTEPAYQTLDLTDYWNRVKNQTFTVNNNSQNQVAFLSNLTVTPSTDNIINEPYQLPDNMALTNRYNADHTALDTNVSANNDDSLIAINGNTTINNNNTSDSVYSSNNGVIAVKFDGNNPVLHFTINGDDASNETPYFGLSTVANDNWSQSLATQPAIGNITTTLKRYITIVNPDGTKQVVEQNANSVSTKSGYLWTPTTFDAYNAPTIAGYVATPVNSAIADHTISDTVLYYPAKEAVTVNYKFVDSKGNILGKSSFVGPNGSTQAINLQLPQGYQLSGNTKVPTSLSFIKDQTIQLPIEPISKPATIILQYVTVNGKVIAQSTLKGNKVGDTIQLNFKIPRGYRLAKGAYEFNNKVKINNQTETLAQIVEKIPEQGQTIYQLFDRNDQLIKTVTLSGPVNSEVSFANRVNVSDNYMTSELPKQVVIDNKTHKVVLDFNPTKLTTTTYTFNDVTNNDKVIGTAFTLSGLKGSTQNIALKVPDGYKLSNNQKIPTLITLDGQKHQILVEPTKQPITDQQVTMFIRFVDKDGNVIGKTLSVSGKLGSQVPVNLQVPEHYKLNSVALPTTVQIKQGNFDLPVSLKSSILLVHLISDDGKINLTRKFEGLEGNRVRCDYQLPSGYQFANGQSVPTSFVLGDKDTEITFELTKSNSQNGQKIVNLVDAFSGKIIESYTIFGKLNETKKFTPKLPTSYKLVSKAPNTIIFDNRTLLLKVGQPVTNTLQIVDNNGNVLSSQSLSGYVGEKKKTNLRLPDNYKLLKDIPELFTLRLAKIIKYQAVLSENSTQTDKGNTSNVGDIKNIQNQMNINIQNSFDNSMNRNQIDNNLSQIGIDQKLPSLGKSTVDLNKVNSVNTNVNIKAQPKQAKLPQTGNSQSLVLVALGTLTSMFGFGLMRKRRY
ncbi:MucBP domain-containing protein [Limosilactobacillus reuteri]|uniref:Rib/alpha-like domain-containing protein n=1 Tax=Limosilactobacillus reuteri TaxID=1598 RepID=UPI001E60A828|nr:Rib/alpha-like domain-containing protein [Limosilactobacillus reuteri]MCC4400038.1 MucBP domain-containing protein [Limosilactobacillus reuteri]MCC4403454.1 MucBP domain-containing protein [Limosilactobacillus reuteri]